MLDTCKRLEKEGFEVTYLPVGKDGRVTPRRCAAAMTDKTIARVDHARQQRDRRRSNPVNEIGAVGQGEGRAVPHRRRAGRRARSRSTSTRRRSTWRRCRRTRCTAPRASARCTCGASRACASPRMIDGGGHERGMRSGTLNVPAIVGFGKAAEIAQHGDGRARRRGCCALRERLREGIQSQADRDVRQRLDGAPAARQPQHLLRLRRGRGDADGAQGRRGVVGLGLHVGVAGAVLRAARARRRRGAGAHVDPLRPRPVQHRGRGRLRDRRWSSTRSRSCASCRRSTRWRRGHRSEEHRQWAAH